MEHPLIHRPTFVAGLHEPYRKKTLRTIMNLHMKKHA
jgi:hypothetical protein